jgi:hypothetical protein
MTEEVRALLLCDIHHKLRAGDLDADRLADLYEISPHVLRRLEGEPAERIEEFERRARVQIEDWDRLEVQDKLAVWEETTV